MSILQTYDNKMRSFWVDVDGHSVPIDHVLQMTLKSAVGILGEPGSLVITAQAFRLLNEDGMNWNPVGKSIEFIIEDPKSGERPYSGVITSFQKYHNDKQDAVVLGFDKPHWVKLNKVRWWKCFDHCTILDITKQFFEAHGVPFNQYPENHAKLRGTHWENFCTPINGPTLPYLLEELVKDNFIYFANPETGGIVVVNWSDIGRLDTIAKNFEDYVVDGILAKYDETSDVWKNETFTFGKQIGTDLPWKIQNFASGHHPDISEVQNHEHTFYTGLKKPLQWNDSIEQMEENDIGLKEVEQYPGTLFDSMQLLPYPSLDNLIDQDQHPKGEYGSEYAILSQSITHPRYMYYRMQQSYAKKIHLVPTSITIPGSCKMVVPMTCVPVSYYENARVEDPKEIAVGDHAQSGLYLIWSSTLSVVGPNLVTTLNLVKPYH